MSKLKRLLLYLLNVRSLSIHKFQIHMHPFLFFTLITPNYWDNSSWCTYTHLHSKYIYIIRWGGLNLTLIDFDLYHSRTRRRKRVWAKWRRSKPSFTKKERWTMVWTSLGLKRKSPEQLVWYESAAVCSPSSSRECLSFDRYCNFSTLKYAIKNGRGLDGSVQSRYKPNDKLTWTGRSLKGPNMF